MADSLKADEAVELKALLAPFMRSSGPRYRSAPWLENDYYDVIWRINSDTQFEIDWQVKLLDGTLLTSTRHSSLLEVFRCWPIARLHVDTTGGRLYAPRVERNYIQDTLHCIDYLLMRTESLRLLQHGLSSLSTNDLCSMLASISSNRSVVKSVYEWPKMLSRFLRARIAELDSSALPSAKALCPDIELDIPDVADRLTDLEDREILLARSWLVLNDLYQRGTNGFRLSPTTGTVANSVYEHTLFGRSLVLPLATELCLGPEHHVKTEYPRARVSSEQDQRMTTQLLNRFVSSVSTLTLLREENLDAPRFRVDDLKRFASSLDTKPRGRFRTLPQHVVFPALRAAIEFSIEYGQALVDSYLCLAKEAKAAGVSVGTFANQLGDISGRLPDVCKRLGVRRWTIESNCPTLTNEEWYAALRSNVGLYECLLVLFGAIQIVIGTLMARRVGEMLDLVAHDCLDVSGTRLVFRNRKSGPAGMRELEARPIPPIGVRFIKLLESLQSGLIELGFLPLPTNLFSAPAKHKTSGLIRANKTQYFRLLDIFCDWSQTPFDSEGNRFYIRQHQLRRFFAMLFFWGGGFGGMDTLRWFLGHTDAKHLWHYITESVPGITIRTVAAEWAAYGVKHTTKEAEVLGEELARHFGTPDFSVLDEDALVLHIEDLLEEGRLTIEPEFLDGGRSYRIAVILRPKSSP